MDIKKTTAKLQKKQKKFDQQEKAKVRASSV